MSRTYFAQDGNYGSADGIVVLDTSMFTDEDWQEIDEASDIDRVDCAWEIAKHYAFTREIGSEKKYG